MLTVRSTINIAGQTVPQIIPVVQGDTARAILFTLADFTIPAGAAATYYVQKPSGEAVYNNATIDGNNVLVNLTAQSIIEKGDNYGQVRITVGEEVVTSFDFILLVKEFRGIDAVQSLTEMNIFDKAVEQASEAIDEVKTDALEAIDDAKEAAVEEVTSNFDLQLNATSIKGVQNQVITQAINTVNNAIGDLSGETVTPTATNNYGVGGNVGQVIETWATTEYWHGIYTVSAGNTYGITTVSDFPQQLVVWFTNASNTIIENHKAFATDHVEMVCTAPTGATKLFVMSYGYDAYHGTVQKVEPLSETVSNLKDDFDSLETALETKAEIDGYYEEMTVGNAEQLVSTVTNADDTPYNFRTTAGSADVGDRAYVDAIVGGSLVVNQLVKSFVDTKTINGVTFTANGGAITVSGTATSNAPYPLHTVPLFANHVYYLKGCPDGGRSGVVNRYAFYANETNPQLFDTGSGSMQKQTADTTGVLYFIVYSGQTVDFTFIPQLFDVTQELGVTVADYALSLETATAGSGVAWLKQHFPKIFNAGYVPYNAGTMVHVSGLSAKKTVGFNQCTENWRQGDWNNAAPKRVSLVNTDRIPLIGGQTYYISCSSPNNSYRVSCAVLESIDSTSYFDVIGFSTGTTYTTSKNCYLAPVVMRSDDSAITPEEVKTNCKVCINLSDTSRNGTYEPYTEHTYPLDSTIDLHGMLKLDSNNQLYADGDVYKADGTVQRRYGVVDLGTLNWTKSGNPQRFEGSAIPNAKAPATTYTIPDIMTDIYMPTYSSDGSSDRVIILNINGEPRIYDSAKYQRMSASEFKTAMNGVMCVYELTTPTTETAEPYNPNQICDPNGTEEYISTTVVPVGHVTRYPENLRKKIEELPWNFATLIAPTEATFKATRNYTTGSLFIVNNVLYKATANIANGATITPNTNCTATTLAEVISALS